MEKTNNMDLVRPYKIKSLEDESVKNYLKWAVKFKSIDTIIDEINSSLVPKAKRVTADEVTKYYMELQQKSEELTKEQLISMTKSYLENNKLLTSSDYVWIQEHAFILIDFLDRVKEKTVYNLGAEIYRNCGRIIPPKYIKKHFQNIGIDLPFGDRKAAIKRCGPYYRKKLVIIENRNKPKKQKANKQ